MAHKYTISVIAPEIPKPKPFDWKAHDAAIAEIEGIIQDALMRDFRGLQAAKIKEMLGIKVCPKCRGKLFPSEDGMKCFSCGMIVHKEMYRGDVLW